MQKKVTLLQNDHFLSDEDEKEERKGQNVDIIRLQRIRQVDHVIDEKGHQPPKTLVKMHKFRQETRKQQRQFHHQVRQCLKLSSALSTSAFDDNKFKIAHDDRRPGHFVNRFNMKKQNINELMPAIRLKLNTEFSEGHLKEKFKINEIYLRTPYKKQSIQFNPSIYLHPQNQFFIFECQKAAYEVTRLFQEMEEEILALQFKDSVKRVTYYLDFFDYIYLINKPDVQSPDKQPYSVSVQTIARHAIDSNQILSESDQPYDQRLIQVPEIVTDHRIVICKAQDLGQFPESLYFSTVELYSEYKKLRAIEFKAMKIYQKDIEINTDVRNIISSQKIYLIEIMKEIKLFTELSKEAQTYKVIKSIHSQLKVKIHEFLKLICGYSESQITSKFNIKDQNERIFQFLSKSVKYGRTYREPDPQIISKFPVMDIWYSLPIQLFGYQRHVLHNTLYQLIELEQELQKKIAIYEVYQKLKNKQSNMKYYPDIKN